MSTRMRWFVAMTILVMIVCAAVLFVAVPDYYAMAIQPFVATSSTQELSELPAQGSDLMGTTGVVQFVTYSQGGPPFTQEVWTTIYLDCGVIIRLQGVIQPLFAGMMYGIERGVTKRVLRASSSAVLIGGMR